MSFGSRPPFTTANRIQNAKVQKQVQKSQERWQKKQEKKVGKKK